MSYATQMAATLNVCYVPEPHGADVAAIVGNNMCAEGGAVQTVSMFELADYLRSQGWDAIATASTISVNDQVETRAFLLACDYSSVMPGALRHDLCEGMKEQGFCLSGNCTG